MYFMCELMPMQSPYRRMSMMQSPHRCLTQLFAGALQRRIMDCPLRIIVVIWHVKRLPGSHDTTGQHSDRVACDRGL